MLNINACTMKAYEFRKRNYFSVYPVFRIIKTYIIKQYHSKRYRNKFIFIITVHLIRKVFINAYWVTFIVTSEFMKGLYL